MTAIFLGNVVFAAKPQNKLAPPVKASRPQLPASGSQPQQRLQKRRVVVIHQNQATGGDVPSMPAPGPNEVTSGPNM